MHTKLNISKKLVMQETAYCLHWVYSVYSGYTGKHEWNSISTEVLLDLPVERIRWEFLKGSQSSSMTINQATSYTGCDG